MFVRTLLAAAFTGALLLHPIAMRPERDVPIAFDSQLLVHAIATGNALLRDLCFREGVSVQAADAEQRTPLLVATLQRDSANVRRLLDLGASVDTADRTGRTPLMIAAAQGDQKMLAAFLERSRCPEIADDQGHSALYHALAAHQMKSGVLLLARIPTLSPREPESAELLRVACEMGASRIVAAVLERLPDELEWTTSTRAALKFALVARAADLLAVILRKHVLAPMVEGASTPLLAEAIAKDDAETFRALLAAGVDPNTVLPKPVEKDFVTQLRTDDLRAYARGDEGLTPLMIAAGLGKPEYVRALLDAGAERFRQTKRYKMLALYFAAHARESRSVQLLLGRGPSPEELRIEISLATQKASVIKDGVAILSTPVSTGRKGYDTPAGEYVITDKQRNHISSLYHVEMPYFMRLNCLDFGMHAGNVPNYPASHGCIRLPAGTAEKLFSQIPVGTVVTIN